jgi:hypothetical protein
MPLGGFEFAKPTNERPQTHALKSATTGTASLLTVMCCCLQTACRTFWLLTDISEDSCCWQSVALSAHYIQHRWAGKNTEEKLVVVSTVSDSCVRADKYHERTPKRLSIVPILCICNKAIRAMLLIFYWPRLLKLVLHLHCCIDSRYDRLTNVCWTHFSFMRCLHNARTFGYRISANFFRPNYNKRRNQISGSL